MMHKDRLRENGASPSAATSAGQAALLLVESLIHELVALRHLPLDQAIAVVDVAIDTAGEIAFAQIDGQRDDDRVGSLLQAIAQTLLLDVDDQTAVGE